MLTSLKIDDDLYRMAKASAASQGITITKYLDQALRLQLAFSAGGTAQQKANSAKPLSLPTCPVALKQHDFSLDDLSSAQALLDAQDAARLTHLAQPGLPNGE
jgi:hypothetical protein